MQGPGATAEKRISLRHALRTSIILSILAGVAGCGFFSRRQEQWPVAFAPPPYAGLSDKSLAIVVYAQPATLNEFAGVREEVSAFVANQMRLHLPTTRILNAQEVIDWQNSTINWYGLSEKDIGKHFSVDRVLFVDVLDYSTRHTLGNADLRGHLRAHCKMTEVDGEAVAPVWNGTVDTFWPPDRALAPTETNEGAVRLRTLEVFSDTLVHCFYSQG